MITPKSFIPYHGCFGRFQGCRETPVNFNSGEWIEVVGKRGKKKRSERFACSVALGPSNNQAGTNLKSAHAESMSHVMSGGNQVRVPSTGFAYSGLGIKRTVAIGNGGRNPPKRIFVKLGSKKQQVKHQKGQKAQKDNKRNFAELEKWLNRGSKELHATSTYLLECQVEANSQLFKAHYRNVLKDRAEILKHTTMLNGTLAAAWRIRHEIVKLEIARLPERYHKTAWCLVKSMYFQSLGNRQLMGPIFNNLIKIAIDNATIWENIQTLEQSAGTIEGSYNSFVSTASKFNKNFTYPYPGQSHGEIHAEIPEEIPGQCPVEGQSERSTAQPYQHCPRANDNLDRWHSGSKHKNNFITGTQDRTMLKSRAVTTLSKEPERA
jgi:hypothetical protein